VAKIEAKSDVTGFVTSLEAKVGDRLDPGGVVMFIESMKMQIPVTVEDGGTVRQILVAEADTVTEGQVVAILEE
jgi:acetyl-CoA carboxylase biotin carboxyl carrier protein